MSMPAGTVTFLFTDIEGSSRLWEQHPAHMNSLLARHDGILRQAVQGNGGHVIKSTGDGIHAVFDSAAACVCAALRAQLDLCREAWEEISPGRLRVRMGLHTGEAEERAGDYYGASLNRAARLMALAAGGQVLLSNATAELVRELLPPGAGLLDLGEHELRNLTRPERLFQLQHPDLKSDFPALGSARVHPHNLPVQLTSFIGRGEELAAAGRQLETASMLTLIGPGGTGKTRLALELGAQKLVDFKDGVWVVELAPLSSGENVLQAIASVFSVHELPGLPMRDQLLDLLRARQLLLILDNCEHMVEACASMAGWLLGACPGMKIIASSREALGIAGEAVYRVPSLSLPEGEDLESLQSSEAARLFVERARMADPAFALSQSNAPHVAQICTRLDGIPLAIELAAARLAVFSPGQMAARLDDRFRLLTGGSRTALPRQQTLRALIDWSYGLLTPEEMKLFRQLSVFAGGWTFEAAEGLCPDLDVFEALPQLVNKSLVTVEDSRRGRRYRFLETIRQYALERLLEEGGSEGMRDAHMRYFLALAESITPRVDMEEGPSLISALEAENENFRAAIAWGLDSDVQAALRLVGSLSYLWFRRGQSAEGVVWTIRSLERFDYAQREGRASSGDVQRESWERAHAGALQALTWLRFNLGDPPGVLEAGGQLLPLARRLGERNMIVLALTVMSVSRLALGQPEGVEEDLKEALELARQTGDKFFLGFTLGMTSFWMNMKGDDPQAARALEEESYALIQQSGKTWGATMLFYGMSRSAMYRGDYESARRTLDLCLPVFEEMGDPHRTNMIRSEFAHIERYEGNYEEALSRYRQTLPVWQKLGHRAAIAHQLECFGFIAAKRGEPARAARLLGAAEALREQIHIPMAADERPGYEAEVEGLRGAMPGEELEAKWGAGRLLAVEAAVKLALE